MTTAHTDAAPANDNRRPTVIDIMEAIRQVSAQDVPEDGQTPEAPRLTVELDPGMRVILDAFVAAKQLKRYADAQKEHYEELIRKALGGAKIGTIEGREVVQLNDSHTSRLDTETVKSGWPECFEAAYRRTDYDWVAVK